MVKCICLAIILFANNLLHAQSNPTPVFLNHVYFVLDSNGYRHLFDSAFLKELGTQSESKTTTTSGSWAGKYFYGLNSYFEIFPPNGFPGAAPGTFGLGFMTFKPGDIEKIKHYWQQHSKDSMNVDTTTWISGSGKKLSWYYSIGVYEPDTLAPVYTWIMENTPEDLRAIGFTDEEIKGPIGWATYMEKISGKKFSKAFTRITSIDVVADGKEYKYLQHSFLNFGLQQKHHNFFNQYVVIRCRKAHVSAPQLKKITIELDKSFEERTVDLNDHLTLNIKGKIASFNFK